MDDGRRAEPGLALRMQRERRVISAQHRQLDDFYARLAAALDAGEAPAARSAFQRFSDALEAHLALEDGIYFPALRGLRPTLESDLEAFSDEHHALREHLVGLARLVEAGPCAPCQVPLGRLVADLAEHEGREEGLLASLRIGEAALGVHVPLGEHVTLSVAYERPITEPKGIFQQRLTSALAFEF